MKDVIEALKSKDKEKVSSSVRAEVDSARDWLQEHGEWALLVGILGGILFVLFFKIIILLIVLGGLASYVIWQLSLENDGVGTYLDKGDFSRFSESATESKPVVDVDPEVEPQHLNGDGEAPLAAGEEEGADNSEESASIDKKIT